MSEEFEERLLAIRTAAYAAFSDAVESRRFLPQAFAIGVEAYEAELRLTASITAASDADFAGDFEHLARARTNLRQMIDAATFGTPEHLSLQMILSDLDAVLGPDLLREADPSGEILKPLPLAERKRMLDVLDSVQKVIDERGGGQPPYIVIVEDEMGPIMERARQLREKALEVGSPEHDAFCLDETAKMAAEDVARGEGE